MRRGGIIVAWLPLRLMPSISLHSTMMNRTEGNFLFRFSLSGCSWDPLGLFTFDRTDFTRRSRMKQEEENRVFRLVWREANYISAASEEEEESVTWKLAPVKVQPIIFHDLSAKSITLLLSHKSFSTSLSHILHTHTHTCFTPPSSSRRLRRAFALPHLGGLSENLGCPVITDNLHGSIDHSSAAHFGWRFLKKNCMNTSFLSLSPFFLLLGVMSRVKAPSLVSFMSVWHAFQPFS